MGWTEKKERRRREKERREEKESGEDAICVATVKKTKN